MNVQINFFSVIPNPNSFTNSLTNVSTMLSTTDITDRHPPSKLVLVLCRRLFFQLFQEPSTSNTPFRSTTKMNSDLRQLGAWITEHLFKSVFARNVTTTSQLDDFGDVISENGNAIEEAPSNQTSSITTWNETVLRSYDEISKLNLSLEALNKQIQNYGKAFMKVRKGVANMVEKWQKPTLRSYFTTWVQYLQSSKQVTKVASLQSANLKLIRLCMQMQSIEEDDDETEDDAADVGKKSKRRKSTTRSSKKRLKLTKKSKPIIRSWIKVLLKGWRNVICEKIKKNTNKQMDSLKAHQRTIEVHIITSREKLFTIKRDKIRTMSNYLEIEKKRKKKKDIYEVGAVRIDTRQEGKCGNIVETFGDMSQELMIASTATLATITASTNILLLHCDLHTRTLARSFARNSKYKNHLRLKWRLPSRISLQEKVLEDILSMQYICTFFPDTSRDTGLPFDSLLEGSEILCHSHASIHTTYLNVMNNLLKTNIYDNLNNNNTTTNDNNSNNNNSNNDNNNNNNNNNTSGNGTIINNGISNGNGNGSNPRTSTSIDLHTVEDGPLPPTPIVDQVLDIFKHLTQEKLHLSQKNKDLLTKNTHSRHNHTSDDEVDEALNEASATAYDQMLTTANANYDTKMRLVEEDRLRLFLLRLEQIGNVAYRSRQQQNNVQHHVLEMQAARRKVMETTWEHSSSDAQIMLASWRTSKRKTFTSKVLPRFLKWSIDAKKGLIDNVGTCIHNASFHSIDISNTTTFTTSTTPTATLENDLLESIDLENDTNKKKRSLSQRGWHACSELMKHTRERTTAENYVTTLKAMKGTNQRLTTTTSMHTLEGGSAIGNNVGITSSGTSGTSGNGENGGDIDVSRTSLNKYVHFDLLDVSGSSMAGSLYGSTYGSKSISSQRSTFNSQKMSTTKISNKVISNGLDYTEEKRMYQRKERMATMMVISELKSRLEMIYAYYIQDNTELSMRQFTQLFKDSNLFKKKKKKKKKKKLKNTTESQTSMIHVPCKDVVRRVMKQAQLDIIFVRVTQSQTNYSKKITTYIDLQKKIKLSKASSSNKTKKNKDGVTTKIKKKIAYKIVKPSLTSSSLLSRAGFVQGLLSVAVARYGTTTTTLNNNLIITNNNNNNNSTNEMNSSDASDPNYVLYLLQTSAVSQADCLLRLLHCDIFPRCKLLDVTRHNISMNT